MQLLMRLPAVQALLGDNRPPRAFAQWLRRLENQGKFPARVRVSARLVAWHTNEVEAWAAGLPRAGAK